MTLALRDLTMMLSFNRILDFFHLYLHPTYLSLPHSPPSLISPFVGAELSCRFIVLQRRLRGRLAPSAFRHPSSLLSPSRHPPDFCSPGEKETREDGGRRRGREATVPEGPRRKAGQQRHV